MPAARRRCPADPVVAACSRSCVPAGRARRATWLLVADGPGAPAAACAEAAVAAMPGARRSCSSRSTPRSRRTGRALGPAPGPCFRLPITSPATAARRARRGCAAQRRRRPVRRRRQAASSRSSGARAAVGATSMALALGLAATAAALLVDLPGSARVSRSLLGRRPDRSLADLAQAGEALAAAIATRRRRASVRPAARGRAGPTRIFSALLGRLGAPRSCASSAPAGPR